MERQKAIAMCKSNYLSWLEGTRNSVLYRFLMIKKIDKKDVATAVVFHSIFSEPYKKGRGIAYKEPKLIIMKVPIETLLFIPYSKEYYDKWLNYANRTFYSGFYGEWNTEYLIKEPFERKWDEVILPNLEKYPLEKIGRVYVYAGRNQEGYVYFTREEKMVGCNYSGELLSITNQPFCDFNSHNLVYLFRKKKIHLLKNPKVAAKLHRTDMYPARMKHISEVTEKDVMGGYYVKHKVDKKGNIVIKKEG